jgi:hypothetical protein
MAFEKFLKAGMGTFGGVSFVELRVMDSFAMQKAMLSNKRPAVSLLSTV